MIILSHAYFIYLRICSLRRQKIIIVTKNAQISCWLSLQISTIFAMLASLTDLEFFYIKSFFLNEGWKNCVLMEKLDTCVFLHMK